jgi:hypothetical protein
MRLAAFPMARPQSPAIALADPGMRHPMTSGPPLHPMTGDPFVPAADPAPITAHPDISRRGRDADDFDARRRRRNHDNPTRIVTLVGHHHASWQYDSTDEAHGYNRPSPGALIHKDTTSFKTMDG